MIPKLTVRHVVSGVGTFYFSQPVSRAGNQKEAARWRNVLRTCRIFFLIPFASKRFP
nr:hypothetical protein SHINE37_41797 [Rhizobiaceae bacterium]